MCVWGGGIIGTYAHIWALKQGMWGCKRGCGGAREAEGVRERRALNSIPHSKEEVVAMVTRNDYVNPLCNRWESLQERQNRKSAVLAKSFIASLWYTYPTINVQT